MNVIAELDKPISRELLGSAIPARLSYTGLDGGPRVIPIGFLWTGKDLVVCSTPKMAKVRALKADPRVALTIDSNGFPPRALLIRGTATLEPVDGVPDEYLTAARKLLAPEQFPAWEASVRDLYDQMVRITIRPAWARLLDFETTLPKAVEDLMRAKETRQQEPE